MQVKEGLEKRGCQIRTGCEVNSVLTDEEGLVWFYFWLVARVCCADYFIIIVDGRISVGKRIGYYLMAIYLMEKA